MTYFCLLVITSTFTSLSAYNTTGVSVGYNELLVKPIESSFLGGYAHSAFDYMRSAASSLGSWFYWGNSEPQDEADKYPANYNETKEEMVRIDGKDFIKRKVVFKQSTNNSFVSFFL